MRDIGNANVYLVIKKWHCITQQYLTGEPRAYHSCMILHSFLLALIATSLFSLVAVSIDRCWAICWPVTYHITGPRVTKLMVMLCWIMGMIFGLSPAFYQDVDHYKGRCDHSVLVEMNRMLLVHVSIALLSTLAIIVLYVLIYRTIKKQVRKFFELNLEIF